MVCSYGCKQEAKFELKNKKWCCSESFNKCPELKKRNSEGLKKSYNSGISKPRGFANKQDKTLWLKSREAFKQNLENKPFEELGNRSKRKLILAEQNNLCLLCSCSEFHNNMPLKFELDHIDGDNSNNVRMNLRLICPNCHSQTETWKKGIDKKNIKKVDEAILLKSLQNAKSIREALLNVGISGKGYNYVRAYKLIIKHKINILL